MKDIKKDKSGSEKAGNKHSWQWVKTIIEPLSGAISHEVQKVMIDSEGDIVHRFRDKKTVQAQDGAFDAFLSEEMFVAVEASIEADVNPE